MHLIASRYCEEAVEVVVSAKSRLYCNKMASLMKVVLAQYATLLAHTCYGSCQFQVSSGWCYMANLEVCFFFAGAQSVKMKTKSIVWH